MVPDLQNGMYLDFQLKIGSQINKETPYLQIAKPEEAKEIPEIFNNAYNGTYPYNEFTDVQEVREMINDPNFNWILFKLKSDEVIGCYGFHINLEEKHGTFHGFTLKREYQKRVDTVKLGIGCMYAILSTYKNKILVWSCEIRTAHTITQYMGTMCGLIPIAFFPNKDTFFNRIESTILTIMYDEKALKKYHCKDHPNTLTKASYCYLYSKSKFDLLDVRYKNPTIELDSEKLQQLKKQIKIDIKPYKMSFEKVTFYYENSDSFFEFLFTPHILNCDKTQYKVKCLEELYLFTQEVRHFMKKHKVRYYEIFVSAYDPFHQKIFYDAGFMPRGYIPSWKYNKETGKFEDFIVFNYFKGEVENVQIIPQSESLLNTLNFTIDFEPKTEYIQK